MGLTGALFGISKQICPHCKQTYGEVGGKKGHSKKEFMKCLYTANFNLYNAVMEINRLKSELEKLNAEPLDTTPTVKDGEIHG